MKFAYVINISSFFHSHFFELATHTLSLGHEVHIIAGDDEKKELYESLGFHYHVFPLTRDGRKLTDELKVIKSLNYILSTLNADVVHAFTAKPVLYCGLLSKLNKKARPSLIVLSVTGLGSISLARDIWTRILWKGIKFGYRFIASAENVHVIFENEDDLDEFITSRIIETSQATIVNGAGINTSEFTPFEKEVNGSLVKVVFLARMLKDKGVREYIEAAEILWKRGVAVDMLMVGDTDPDNISSLTDSEIEDAKLVPNITYLGYRTDVLKIYQSSDIVCLPSYREGLPKSLIEAASCGLPIVTTDTPGCRQLISKDYPNGILVKVNDADAIADALEYLVSNAEIRINMGVNSRLFALERFDYKKVLVSFERVYKLAV